MLTTASVQVQPEQRGPERQGQLLRGVKVQAFVSRHHSREQRSGVGPAVGAELESESEGLVVPPDEEHSPAAGSPQRLGGTAHASAHASARAGDGRSGRGTGTARPHLSGGDVRRDALQHAHAPAVQVHGTNHRKALAGQSLAPVFPVHTPVLGTGTQTKANQKHTNKSFTNKVRTFLRSGPVC